MDIRNMTNEELKNLSKLISEEQTRRENHRFDELINKLLVTVKEIEKEFPGTTWYTEVDDGYGSTQEVDIFEYIFNARVDDFVR